MLGSQSFHSDDTASGLGGLDWPSDLSKFVVNDEMATDQIV